MRVSEEFILREIAGESMLVPMGHAAEVFNGLITLNSAGRFLFTALKEERTADELTALLTGEYDIDAATARADLEDFLQQLREVGALIEDHD